MNNSKATPGGTIRGIISFYDDDNKLVRRVQVSEMNEILIPQNATKLVIVWD